MNRINLYILLGVSLMLGGTAIMGYESHGPPPGNRGLFMFGVIILISGLYFLMDATKPVEIK